MLAYLKKKSPAGTEPNKPYHQLIHYNDLETTLQQQESRTRSITYLTEGI